MLAYNTTLHRILPFWVFILTGFGMQVSAVALFIAPINATIFGAVGATISLIVSGLYSKVGSVARTKIPTAAT